MAGRPLKLLEVVLASPISSTDRRRKKQNSGNTEFISKISGDLPLTTSDIISLLKSDFDLTEEEFRPQGFNVGFNVGDMDDPTGGVRHVIPERGRYNPS